MVRNGFNPHLRLLTAQVLQFKWPLDFFQPHQQVDDWWPGIVMVFIHARMTEYHHEGSQMMLIDKLDSTLCQHWAFCDTIENDHWARSLFSSYEIRKKAVIHDPFLCLAAKFSLSFYVHGRFKGKASINPSEGTPLLSRCVKFLVSCQQTVCPLSNPQIICDLLDHGANPNKSYRDLDGKEKTPWLLCLDNIREGDRCGWIKYYDTGGDGVHRVADIVSLFIEYGADPKALLVETKFDPSATALEVITSIYRTYASPDFYSLRQVLLEKGASEREGHNLFYKVYGK